MIELTDDRLRFSFPDVHPEAHLDIVFQRTLRIPDDDRTYPLPPGLGAFPLRHVDDFASAVPADWLQHGGVMLPMYQSEALWLCFSAASVERQGHYPFAIKVATGKIDAVTGKAWSNGLHRKPQDYMIAPNQPWLDGYCVTKGTIRQFVAMPLGADYTAEEQITGEAEHGGLQIIVYPMKRDVFERRFPERKLAEHSGAKYIRKKIPAPRGVMGLAPGGKMKQEIYSDPFDFDDWDLTQSSRCFIHIANSLTWRAITGQTPPNRPLTAADYTRKGFPWFEYYDESQPALEGSGELANLQSVAALGKQKRQDVLPENESCDPDKMIAISLKRLGNQVREGAF